MENSSFAGPEVRPVAIEIPSAIEKHIHELVKADLLLSNELLQLMKQEREALTQRNLELVTQLVEAKVIALEKLDYNSQQRCDLMRQVGLEVDEKQWPQVIAKINNPKLQMEWHELLKTVELCKQTNTVNGKMVARGQQTLARLLSIFRGQVSIPELYDQRGGTTNNQCSRTSIKI